MWLLTFGFWYLMTSRENERSKAKEVEMPGADQKERSLRGKIAAPKFRIELSIEGGLKKVCIHASVSEYNQRLNSRLFIINLINQAAGLLTC